MNLKKRARFIAMAQHRAIVEGMNSEPLDRAMKYFKNRTAKEAVLKKQKIIEEKCECEICKYGFVPVLQVHHIIPVSEGGDNEQENLILLCPNCHKKSSPKFGVNCLRYNVYHILPFVVAWERERSQGTVE